MKKLFYVLISILMLSFGACNSSTGSDSQSDSLTKLNDSLAKVHPSLLDDDPWNDTTEYTPETYKQWCDTLIGNFSGKGIDTHPTMTRIYNNPIKYIIHINHLYHYMKKAQLSAFPTLLIFI